MSSGQLSCLSFEIWNMFLLMLIVASSCFMTMGVIFAIYYSVVLRSPKKTKYLRDLDEVVKRTLSADELPDVTVLMAMYNEEAVIHEKLVDILAMEYPHEKLEVILVDDCSTDSTVTIAEKYFTELGLSGEIIRNKKKVGTNQCFNIGVEHSTGALIATTGADRNRRPPSNLGSPQGAQDFEGCGRSFRRANTNFT